jgi:type VI secretion system secreted protein VgrG
MSSPSDNRVFAVYSPLGADALLVRQMHGQERLGRLFEYRVEVLSEDIEIDFNDLLGENLTVRLTCPQQEQDRYFNGFVSGCRELSSQQVRYGRYELTLRPWLWLLTRTADCRIFQDQSVPQMVKSIFSERGFSDFEDHLSGDYSERGYCVQYRETDFDFISRLLEEEGIYYFFKHENGKHILVLADAVAGHESLGKIPYYPEGDHQEREVENIYDWSVSAQLQPGKVVLDDFDFEVPTKALLSTAPIKREHAQADYEIFDYPGEYTETDDGDHYSRVRIEELQARHQTGQGIGNDRTLSTGYLFTLDKLDRKDQNREYLITGAHYTLVSNEYESSALGIDAPTYTCEFSVLDAQQPFRPERLTPRPLIRGPQTAIVVGPSGEEIYTDEHGRVKCQFHWDRYSQADETSSCWIRVSHGWAGKNWGMIALPRIGQEVIVEFLEGNPDQPIITGRVYNGDNQPPYDLPDEKTKSTIKSLSSKGGGGFNEIRFEDKKDDEQIFIHAQKDQDIRVLNDHKEWIGNDRHLIVKNDRFERIENNTHLIVDNDHYEAVKGDKHQKVTGDHNGKVDGSRSLNVGQDIQIKAGSNYALEAGIDVHIKAGTNLIIEDGAQLTLKVGGNFITIGPAGIFIKGSLVMINSGGSAGSGQGSSPDAPTAPKAPKEADTADPGELSEVDAEPITKDPAELTSTQAQAMVSAAESGMPFCEICEALAKQGRK